MKRLWRGMMVWAMLAVGSLVLTMVSVVMLSVMVLAEDGGGGGGVNWLAIVPAILAVVFAALTGTFGVKWAQTVRFLRESSEAVVALGMVGISLTRVLEYPGQVTSEQISRLLEEVRRVSTEFKEAIDAGRQLFSRSHSP